MHPRRNQPLKCNKNSPNSTVNESKQASFNRNWNENDSKTSTYEEEVIITDYNHGINLDNHKLELLQKEVDKSYSNFFAVINPTIQSKSAMRLSNSENGILNTLTWEVLQLMGRHEKTTSKLQFLHQLLLELESCVVSENQNDHSVKLMLLFVQLFRGVKGDRNLIESKFLKEENISNHFDTLFETAFKRAKKYQYSDPAAKNHLNILSILCSEIEELGLSVKIRKSEENCQKIVQKHDPEKMPRLEEVKRVDKEIPTKPKEIATQTTEPVLIKLVDSDEEEFNIFSKEKDNLLETFRFTRDKLTQDGFGTNSSEFRRVVTTLTDSFRRGQIIGRFRMEQAFFEILFQQDELSNLGRKAVLWTMAELFSHSDPKSLKLYKTEAELLLCIIENFNVSQGDPKNDTIELLAIQSRFKKYPQYLPSIDELVLRLTIQKYKPISKISPITLKMEDFYPLNLSVIDPIAEKILEEIPELNDFLRSCKELQGKLYCKENKKSSTR